MSDDGRIWSLTRRTAIATAVLGALLLAGSAFAGPQVGAGHGAAANRARARRDAARSLTLLALPAGATRSATVPAGSDGGLERPGQVPSGQLVDVHAFWVLSGTPSGVMAYVRAHPPASGTLDSTESGNTGSMGEGFGFPPVAGVLSSRQLIVSAVPLAGGMVGVRADGQDIWVTPRPAWDRVPAGVATIMITASVNGAVSSEKTVTSRADIHAIVRLVNRLALFPKGVFSCPAGTDESVRLQFRSATGATLASALESPTGCASVTLTVGDHRGPGLSDNPSVSAELERLGLLRLPATGIGPIA
ncbi:MAG TPA: hypothetical protein VG223_15165 [Solirubrobacteraceae bacterium]|nr:hypothetical protein [Solirubrobacteraceae bacterium]